MFSSLLRKLTGLMLVGLVSLLLLLIVSDQFLAYRQGDRADGSHFNQGVHTRLNVLELPMGELLPYAEEHQIPLLYIVRPYNYVLYPSLGWNDSSFDDSLYTPYSLLDEEQTIRPISIYEHSMYASLGAQVDDEIVLYGYPHRIIDIVDADSDAHFFDIVNEGYQAFSYEQSIRGSILLGTQEALHIEAIEEILEEFYAQPFFLDLEEELYSFERSEPTTLFSDIRNYAQASFAGTMLTRSLIGIVLVSALFVFFFARIKTSATDGKRRFEFAEIGYPLGKSRRDLTLNFTLSFILMLAICAGLALAIHAVLSQVTAAFSLYGIPLGVKILLLIPLLLLWLLIYLGTVLPPIWRHVGRGRK